MKLHNLPYIDFTEKDPDTLKTAVISAYETAYHEATGERITLYPADPRRLFLLSIAEMIIIQRNLIDWTAKQNLLAYATGPRLDHLGALVGVERLSAQYSRATVQFNLSAEQAFTVVIPAGTRVAPSAAEIYFATEADLEIAPGLTSGEVRALALETGTAPNGLLPKQINRLVDPQPWVASITNITESAGGAEIEEDENLRERINLAPESFSVAGPTGAYKYWARTASQLIIDVEVYSPSPCVVHVFPLLIDGQLPTQEIIDDVIKALGADDVRPTSELVEVLSPTPIEYDLDVTWYLDRSNVTAAASIQQAVPKAAENWAYWQRTALGRDINPSVLIARMVEAGAKRVEVNSPSFTVLEVDQVAIPASINVVYGGVEDG